MKGGKTWFKGLFRAVVVKNFGRCQACHVMENILFRVDQGKCQRLCTLVGGYGVLSNKV
jgi:hypothetical protein